MSDRDHGSDDELIARLRSAAVDAVPSPELGQRVLARARARRHRRVARIAAAGLVVVATAGTVLAVRGHEPGRLQTSDETPAPSAGSTDAPAPSTGDSTVTAGDPDSAPADETFPPSSARPVNILVVGVDNGACVDPDSKYAPAFGDRSSMGERSDTIMIVRVDPAGHRADIVSFPRDLWVSVPGRGKGRINATFVRDDPTKLIETLDANFGVSVDHFVQLDFCAFTTVVDAVGGVPVPFDRPTRDTHTGLDVADPGCRTLDGDQALAYVRSRHYETFEGGRWVTDPTSDLGRIARQQDFVQRTVTRLLSSGLDDPAALRSIFGAVQDDVVVDRGLTISTMLELAGELRSIGSSAIGRHQIDAKPETIAGNAVLVPTFDSPEMRQVLALLRGDPASGDPAATSPVGATTAGSDAVDPTTATIPSISC